MGKRGSGEGTIFQRKDNRWVGRISLGRDGNGKRQQKTVYGLTQGEVIAKLDDLKQKAKLNAKGIIGKDSLAGYLGRWLSNEVAVNKAAKTYEEYESATRLHIVPFVGHIKLNKLTGEHLQDWQAEQCRKGYSANQRARSIRVLRNALNSAIRLNLIPNNPMIAVSKPKVERREVTPLEPEKCFALFDACKANRLGEVVTLAIMTGMRLREIFALDWDAVNLSEGVLTVRKSMEEITKKTMVATGRKGTLNEKPPKTRAGKRVITLEPIAVQALKDRLTKARSEGFTPAEVPVVFPDTIGGRLRSSNFNKQCWNPIRESLGIRDVKFHDLRHTQASLMLYAGVDLKVIQSRLGHADFGTTANLYAHLMQDSQADATGKLSSMMQAAKPADEKASEYIR